MGLELIEFISRIEEEFEIIIPDEIATSLNTPKELTDFLIKDSKVSRKMSREAVEILVWQILEDEIGIDRKDFNEDSRFIQDMEMA